ncbi:hypothetical protein CSX00_07175 [Pseudobutyrivibrio ruminis]|uniref:Uncharacterized protein n=1 Tax=Pseudobutyrivibrio ruminis TaxID=46206 RepID=A0A2G3EAR4_9FIRM|nr:DUF6731 family protein [Pseudobutyrivibrio ruminis]PHU40203.1 hypothetical protein CSX00_07175 [Pseudobutyrivibrio ruminis]
MGKKINITCKYYLVKTYTEVSAENNSLYDLRKWINEIRKHSLSDRIIDLGNNTKGRVENISIRDDFYALNFVRMDTYSSTYIVSEDEQAKHVDIEDDEYIGKNTVAVYNSKSSVLMLMSNVGGFSANTVTTYINSFFDEPVCVLSPIKFNKDFTRATNKYGKITIKIKNINDYRPSKDAPYEDVLIQAQKIQAETMSFEFSVRKKDEYLNANVVRTIISDAFDNMGAVSIARVKMQDEQGTALYNLFENVKHCNLSLETNEKGEIAFKAIASAMVEHFE